MVYDQLINESQRLELKDKEGRPCQLISAVCSSSGRAFCANVSYVCEAGGKLTFEIVKELEGKEIIEVSVTFNHCLAVCKDG